MKNILLLIICFGLSSYSYPNKDNGTNNCIDKLIKLLSNDCGKRIKEVNKIPDGLLNLIGRSTSSIAKYNEDIRLGEGAKPDAKPSRMLALFKTSHNKSILFLEQGGVGHTLGIYVYNGTNETIEYKVGSHIVYYGIKKRNFRTKKRILKLLKEKGHRMRCD